MTVFEQFEEKRKTVIGTLVVIAVLTLAISSLRDPYSLDSFWHLKTGQDWVEQSLSPFKDHYSITHFGERISSPPYMFQALLYGAVETFGLERGYKFLVCVGSLLTLALMVGLLKMLRASVLVWLVAIPVLVVFVQQRAFVRPELFAYPLMILSVLLYEKGRLGSFNQVMPLVLLTSLFWINYHSTILVYVIFFGLFLDQALKLFKTQSSPKAWIAWLGWGAALFLVGFINPSFSHPALSMLGFDNEWAEVIVEYQATFKGNVSIAAIFYLLMAFLTLLLALKERLAGYFVVVSILTWSAISMGRMVTPAGIIVVSILAVIMNQTLSQLKFSNKEKSPLGLVLLTVFGLISASSLVTGVLKARQLIESNQYLQGNFPADLVDYMRATKKQGNIFNDYSLGGYLIYQLGDTNRIYIDGRTGILYPFEHYQSWQKATGHPRELRSEIDDKRIDFIILGHRQELVDLVQQAGGLQLDFSDLRYSLYTRQNANFPVTGSLWSSPWCWNDNYQSQLASENVLAKKLLPVNSPATQLNNLALNYSTQRDKQAFLLNLTDDSITTWYESSLRFAGYRAMETGLHELALKWFFRIENRSLKDYLAVILASLRTNDMRQAELVLANAIAINWPIPVFNDFRILQGLMVEISSTNPLPSEQKEFFDQITASLGINSIKSQVTVRNFCDDNRPTN